MILEFVIVILSVVYYIEKKTQDDENYYAQEQKDLTQDENINLLLQLAQEKSYFDSQGNLQNAEDYLTEKFSLKPGELKNLIKENESLQGDFLKKSLSYLISGDYKNALFNLNKVLEHSSDLKKEH